VNIVRKAVSALCREVRVRVNMYATQLTVSENGDILPQICSLDRSYICHNIYAITYDVRIVYRAIYRVRMLGVLHWHRYVDN
jgi:hypothetical protein